MMKSWVLFLLLAAFPLWAQVPQPQVPMSGKIGPGGNFPLFNGGTVTMPTDADYTLAFPEFTGSVLQITSAVSLTATRNVIHTLPSSTGQRFGFEFTVQNATSGNQAIVFKGSSGTGVTIPNGEVRMVIFDGTNYVNAGGGGSGTNEVIFKGVSDAVKDSTCSVTTGSANLTCNDAPFPSPCPNLVGKTVSVTAAIQGATFTRPGNTIAETDLLSLITTIQSCTSSTVAVMALPATNTKANTTARWGTDNGPALFALTNVTQGNQTFRIPAGNYLIRVLPTLYNDVNDRGRIRAHSDTSYIIDAGAHIYYVGPSGCSRFDPDCDVVGGVVYTNQAYSLLWLPSSFYGAPNGTHNVYIELNGIVEGDNTDATNGVGVPYLNQSNIVFWADQSPTNTDIADIVITGSGTLLNTYGFGFHSIGGQRATVTGITHKRVAKGLNVNTSGSQSFNTFIDSMGIEAGAANTAIIGNHFDNSSGISVGGTGSLAQCPGYVVSANSFQNMTGAGIELSQCPVGAVISGNSFWIPLNPSYNAAAINVHDGSSAGDYTPTHDNLIVGNTFYASPGCYAAVWAYGAATGGNIFSQNHMTGACMYGYYFSNWWTGHNAPDVIKGDTLMSTGADVVLSSTASAAGGKLSLQGTILAGTGTFGGQITSDSWYVNASGVTYQGTLSANPLQSRNIAGGVQCVRADANGNFSGTGHDCISGSISSPGILAAFNASGAAPPITVGYHTIGSRTAASSVGNVSFTGFIAPNNVNTFQNCQIYVVDANPVGRFYCALYAADGAGGRPGTRLCYDTIGTNLSQGWTTNVSMNYGSCPNLTPGYTYFIATMQSTATTGAYDSGAPAGMSWYTGNTPNQFPPTMGAVNSNSNISSVAAEVGPAIPVGAYYNAANPIPTDYLGTGAAGNGNLCLLDNHTWGSCAGGAGGSGNVNNGTPAPATYQTAIWQNATTIKGVGPGNAGQVLTSNGGATDPSFQTPQSGPIPVNTLLPATAAGGLSNSNYGLSWNWSLTGASDTVGLKISENAASTNTGANSALLAANTLAGSTVSPFQSLAGANGLKIAANGDITAVGTAKVVGPLQLPALANQPSLGTDLYGNIVAGSGGPGGGSNVLTTPVYSAVFPSVSMLGTASANLLSGLSGCTNSAGTCLALTPPGDGTYLVKWWITQTTPGSPTSGGTGACNAGAVSFRFGFTNADSGVVFLGTLAGMALSAAAMTATLNLSGTANSANNDYAGMPREFRALGGQPITYAAFQSPVSNCDTPPRFLFKIALFGPLGY